MPIKTVVFESAFLTKGNCDGKAKNNSFIGCMLLDVGRSTARFQDTQNSSTQTGYEQ
jgi:hypothetical protein